MLYYLFLSLCLSVSLFVKYFASLDICPFLYKNNLIKCIQIFYKLYGSKQLISKISAEKRNNGVEHVLSRWRRVLAIQQYQLLSSIRTRTVTVAQGVS